MGCKKKKPVRPKRVFAAGEVDIVFAAGETTIQAAEGEDGVPSVEVVAYTGGELSLSNFSNPVVINLQGVRAMDSQQLPFLRDHEVGRPVGHGRPEIGASQLRQSGKLSIGGEDRDTIVAANRDGFRWQASVGGRIPNRERNVQHVARGRTVRVNGRTFQGPVSVINAFTWKETSFVAVGADEGRASASVAAVSAEPQRRTPMNEFERWLEASGINADDLNETQLNNLRATWEASQDSDQDDDAGQPDIAAIVQQATTAAVTAVQERSQRDRQIAQVFANYSPDNTSLSSERFSELRDQVEAGTMSLDAAHVEMLQASRSRGMTSNINAGGGSPGEEYALELEASCGRLAGLSEEHIQEELIEAGATEEQAERAVSRSNGKPRGLKAIIRAVCRQANHFVDEVDDDAIRAAMAYSAANTGPGGVSAASGGFSTVSLPGILSRLANKAMLAAYAEADNGGVALQICSTTSTNDFKKFSRYRMTESGVMELVPASGEIKHGKMTEETYENQVDTYGKIIALTRQMIRNDDLDAFLQIPRMIGRMGRHALEQIVITTLVDAPTSSGAGTTEFFHGALRGNQEPNYLEGAATNLSFDALEPAYELFLNQVDADGKPIMIDPSILLTTNADIVMARKLYTDTQYRFTGSDRTETINNQWEGMFEPIKSAYLHRLGTTPSATQWYLLSRPSIDVSAIQIAFLDGQQTPVIQQSETSFNTLGMQMRGYFDFGVALQDPRAIVKVKGAA